MTVYAQKNARGDLTGQWVVEVTIGGKRLPRQIVGDFGEAKQRELQLKMGVNIVHMVAEKAKRAPQGYTVRDLKHQACVIWKGTKDERQSLQRFNDAMELLGLDTLIADIHTSELDRLIEALRSKGLGDSTIHRYLCTVSAALKWACEHRETGLQTMPVFPWKRLAKGEKRKATLHPEDDTRLLAWATGKGSPDIALVVEMLLMTGMRVGELTKLQPGDFDQRDLTVTIGNWEGATKNGDTRTVPLQEALWLKAVAMSTVGWPSYRRINSALHRARGDLGIKHALTAHVFRHTVVTRLNKAKVPVATIMDLVGHRSMATTKGYTHTDVDTLSNATDVLRHVSSPKG